MPRPVAKYRNAKFDSELYFHIIGGRQCDLVAVLTLTATLATSFQLLYIIKYIHYGKTEIHRSYHVTPQLPFYNRI